MQALALQLGNEVSYNEVAQLLGVDNQTVERYVDLLEKAYVVFRLPSFSRNLRNELKKSRKIYFYDNGIRNALIANFSPLALRQDTGALWENYLIYERKKHLGYNNIWTNTYFWRTHAQQEIDYLEERDGILYAYEFKWKHAKKTRIPKNFNDAYPSNHFIVITPENYTDFLH